MGKFALPSPPDEEDRTQPIPYLSSPSQNNHWKYQYNAATGPRVGLVRKLLIGVKRKKTSTKGPVEQSGVLVGRGGRQPGSGVFHAK